MAPLAAEPIRFLAVFTSTIASAVVLSFFSTISSGISISATTLFPLPSTMLIAAGFLSTQTLPLNAIWVAVVSSASLSRIFSEAIVTIFIPILSPVENTNLGYT